MELVHPEDPWELGRLGAPEQAAAGHGVSALPSPPACLQGGLKLHWWHLLLHPWKQLGVYRRHHGAQPGLGASCSVLM